jgi:ABC-type Fe3+/spermidine/putrescine transport system ATPase subunit
MRAGRIVQTGTPTELYRSPEDPQSAFLFGGANLFHSKVIDGRARSPFGQLMGKSLGAAEWAEILYRPISVRVSVEGIAARVLAVRPYAGQLEVEAAIEPSGLPDGVEAPTLVRAAAPLEAAIMPGAHIKLWARPEDAFVFPCRDKIAGHGDFGRKPG